MKYICPFCGKSFENNEKDSYKRYSLLKHIAAAHKVSTEDFVRQFEEPWEHKCIVCGRPTEYDVRRKRFKYTCRNCTNKTVKLKKQKLICKICNKEFSDMASFGKHLLNVHNIKIEDYRVKYEADTCKKCLRCGELLPKRGIKYCKKCKNLIVRMNCLYRQRSSFGRTLYKCNCFLRKHIGETELPYYQYCIKKLPIVRKYFIYLTKLFKEAIIKWNSILPEDSPITKYKEKL